MYYIHEPFLEILFKKIKCWGGINHIEQGINNRSRNFLKDKQGNIVTGIRRALRIWEEYIQDLYDSENLKDISIEAEDELNEDDKGNTILKREVVKALKDIRRRKKKATADDNIAVDLLKELNDNNMKIIYTSGEWLKGFLDVMMIALPKKNPAKKCSDQRTISLISFIMKTVTHILSKRL